MMFFVVEMLAQFSPAMTAARLWQNKSLFAYLSTLIMTHCGFILSSFSHYINGLQFVVWILGYISLSRSPHLVRTDILRCKFVSGGRLVPIVSLVILSGFEL